MADISRSRTIATSAQDIWEVLADFGAIHQWAPGVDHSCVLQTAEKPVGTTRRVQAGRITLVERITEFTPPNVLAYDIEGLPRRLRHVANRWTLRPAGDGATVVTVTSTIDIGTGPLHRLAETLLSRVLARQSTAMLAGLAGRWENVRV